MNWKKLVEFNQIDQIKEDSRNNLIMIYKHSTRCSTSHMVLDRLERNWKQEEMNEVKPFFLDLIAYRNISNAIADTFEVVHESPQVIFIRDGKTVMDFSHFEIDYLSMSKAIKNL